MLIATVLTLVCGADATHVGNSMLRAQLEQGVVAGPSGLSAEREEDWATTWLEAPSLPGGPATYGPFRLRDGDLRTSWCEGVPGDGVGEVVIGPPIRLDQSVEILIGVAKSPALFAANGRPKRVRVHTLAGNAIGGSRRQEQYGQLRVIGTGEVVLEDVARFQPLAVTVAAPPAPDWELRVFLAIEILEVTPGTKYHDTCITEIRQAPAGRPSGAALRIETPWPAVLPCSGPSTVVCGGSGAADAEWRSPGAAVELPCGLRAGKVRIDPVDPSFAMLVLAGATLPDSFWFRADCGDDEQQGGISWSCRRDRCVPAATYPLRAHAAELPSCASPACAHLAEGKLAKLAGRDAVAALEREARALARALAGAARRACEDDRCAPSVREAGVFGDAVAASRAWTFREIRRAVTGDPTRGKGHAAVFQLSDPPVTAAILCARGFEREDDAAYGCALSLEAAGRRIAFAQDPDHAQQYLHDGPASVIVDLQGSVSLSGGALRTRGR